MPVYLLVNVKKTDATSVQSVEYGDYCIVSGQGDLCRKHTYGRPLRSGCCIRTDKFSKLFEKIAVQILN